MTKQPIKSPTPPKGMAPATDAVSVLVSGEVDLTTDGPAQPDLPRVGGWFTTVYALTYFGFYLVLFVPALFSLAYKVQLIDPSGKEASLGLVVGIGSLVSVVTGPILGVLSDSTRARWGRRRPYIAGGLGLSLVAALIIAAAPSIALLLVGWAVAQLATGLISAGLNPVLAERVPMSQRGKLGAISGVMASLAGVFASLIGSFLTGNILLLFTFPVIVFGVAVVLFLVTVPDESAPADARAGSVMDVFKNLLFDPRKHKDFAWVWIGKFCLQIGLTFFTTYQFYFLLDRLGYTAESAGRQIALVGGFSLLATMLFTVGGGWLSDKLKRRKVFIYIAAGMMAAGSIVCGLAPDFLTFAIGATVMSAGTGAFNSVDLAMATDVLPNKNEAGKYMSIYYLSGTIPGAFAPLLAPVLLAIGGGPANYTALFVFGGVLTVGAAITASRVRGVR